MEYRIYAINPKGEPEIIEDNLSEDEYNTIMSNIHKLQTTMLSKEYYYIVKDNMHDLLRYISNINPKDTCAFSTINRYMYNVLGVFYAWIEYYENNFKDIFSTIKKKYYDDYVEYRLMYNLRIYMTHCEMAITNIHVNYDEQSLFVNIKPKKLLQRKDSLQKKAILDLQKMVDENTLIDVYELIIKFEKIFNSMHTELIKGIEPIIKIVYDDIIKYIRFTGDKAQYCFISEKSSDKEIFGITSFMGLFQNKMCNT